MTENKNMFGLVRMVLCFLFLELHATVILYRPIVIYIRKAMKLFTLLFLLILYIYTHFMELFVESNLLRELYDRLWLG